MKVISSYPIYANGKNINRRNIDMYSGFDNDDFSSLTAEEIAAKEASDKNRQAVIDSLFAKGMSAAEILLQFKKNKQKPPAKIEPSPKPTPSGKKPMSITTKVLIGVAVVALIAGVVYFSKNK